MRSHERHRRGQGAARRAGVLAAGLALASAPLAAAGAQPMPFDRGIDRACTPGAQQPERFDDIGPDTTHGGAVNCLAAYNIVQGRGEPAGGYDPGGTVSRQQMASFVVGMLSQLPAATYELPAPTAGEPFTDHDRISEVHRRNVRTLHAAGIVAGYDDGTFRPGAPVTRAQMSALLTRALQTATGEVLARADGVFGDVHGTHRPDIERLAAIGVVQGRTDGSFGPGATTNRGQMASFVARSLDFLVTDGWMMPIAYTPAEVSQGTVTQVALGAHATYDRAVFTIGDDDRHVGWLVRYVDEARQHGSGNLVEVAGDAVLEVVLIGVRYPTESEQEPWDGETIGLTGDAIIEVVDSGVFEGRHQIFVGTTATTPFTVDRLAGPQRVVVDVEHP
ncbi:S-layer homology domain-containing protein [Egicoccus halophilus]|uniref:SLH domain-containing protein n=1 Tax=Egicoccus halophilus TaxID=1670830 RepID=A0A8J3ABH1_9ACTN|nr:S-layer homology domain-containing protein [Egicoccus halophilus]GGI03189.1 hypothetical protein GCM10011354_02920 [Egicoccus halophilus]